MKALKNTSIVTKQKLITLSVSGATLLVACIGILTYGFLAMRQELEKNIQVLAEATAYNATTAIEFNDDDAATDILRGLRANGSVVAAAILMNDGGVFASYLRDEGSDFSYPFLEDESNLRSGFNDGYYHRVTPVKSGDMEIGTVYLASDLHAVRERFLTELAAFSIGFIVVMLGGWAVSNRLQRLITEPILSLAEASRKVADSKDFSQRATKIQNDELGDLVDTFNEMLEEIQTRDQKLEEARRTLEERVKERTKELESAHRELVNASRHAGMAEIATNVLHNVGNVLNSLNVSACCISEKLKSSRVEKLSQVASVLESHNNGTDAFQAQDEKRKQVVAYLSALSTHMTEDKEVVLKEVSTLINHVEHIKTIIDTQQDLAVGSNLVEELDADALIETCINMNADSTGRLGVVFERRLQSTSPVKSDKHKLTQILNNLIRNAIQACEESSNPEKQVTITSLQERDHLYIQVSDSGVGIPPENLTRIFNHGFTTKVNGHGFGLHSSALAASEMGGKLSVESKGSDKGATFSLQIPLGRPEQSSTSARTSATDKQATQTLIKPRES